MMIEKACPAAFSRAARAHAPQKAVPASARPHTRPDASHAASARPASARVRGLAAVGCGTVEVPRASRVVDLLGRPEAGTTPLIQLADSVRVRRRAAASEFCSTMSSDFRSVLKKTGLREEGKAGVEKSATESAASTKGVAMKQVCKH